MHQRLHRAAVDVEVGQHDVHVGVVVPRLAWRGLVVPAVLAGVGIQRDDGAEEEVVAAAGAADLPVPGRSVAGADVQRVELGIVGEPVPGVAAAAQFPPLARPRLGRHGHRLVLEPVRRVARHDVEAPCLLAGFRVVRRHVAARRAVLRTAVAHQHLALEHLGRAGDVELVLRLDRHGAPQLASGGGVDRVQAAVPRGDVDRVLPECDAPAVIPAGAHAAAGVHGHLRVVFPQQRAGRGIHRAHDVHAADEVQDAVNDERSGDEAALARQVEIPVHRQIADGGRIDPGERAETLLAVRAAEREPVRAGRFVGERRVVDYQSGCALRGQSQGQRAEHQCDGEHGRAPDQDRRGAGRHGNAANRAP